MVPVPIGSNPFLLQWASTIKIQLSVLVKNKATSSSHWKLTCYRH